MKTREVLTTAICLACFLPAVAQPVSTPQAPAFVKATYDAKFQTPLGSTITIPIGWYVMKKGDGYVLQDPDRQLSLVLAEVSGITAYDAIGTAMNIYDPDPLINAGGTGHHKDEYRKEIYSADYFVVDPHDVNRANPNRRITASSYRQNNIWHVQLLDGDVAAIDRREAQIGLIMEGFYYQKDMEKTAPAEKTVSLDEKFLKAFEDFEEHVRDKCKVPGAAIAIVKDGKIVYEKGFGVRESGKNEKVTPQTLFLIASMTKPLTTLLMARLVDAGKIDWDMPVAKLLPSFQLADTQMTKGLTLEYTVCACAGLPRQDMDLIFERVDTTPEAILEKMRVMAPTTGFGETFQYSNIMVTAGGYIAAHAADPTKSLGQAYDDAMQTYVFGPLGMKSTTLDLQTAQSGNSAAPHGETVKTDFTPMPYAYNDCFVPFRPAAGVWSNVEDMAKYISMEMAEGIGPDGTRMVSRANLLKRREPRVAMSQESSYGLGLMIEKMDGVQVIGHGGNAIGYTSTMGFLPDYGVGLIVLCNADHVNNYTDMVERRFVELIASEPSHLQDDFDLNLLKNRGYDRGKGKFYENESRFANWISDYEGDYFNENLGRVSLQMTEEGGVLDMGKWRSAVARTGGTADTVEFTLTTPPLVWMNFILAEQDGHKILVCKSPQQRYVFEQLQKGKKPAAQ